MRVYHKYMITLFLSFKSIKAGTPNGLALLIAPNGLASLYYGLTAHPLFLLLEKIEYVAGKHRICWRDS